ncbi:MAG: hypothetical protein A2V83_07295 [Nitrospirae bacterium RBG_16_64_22]|nr:MAG: hypothetical protein A2V83_07295 [Nitrospirae bacterium RBG_16_64_22]
MMFRPTTALLLPSFVLLFILTGPTPGFAQDQGEKLYKERCSMCHAPPKPEEKTEKQWPKVIEQMAANAQLNAREKESVLKYLVEHARHEAVEARLAAEKKLFEEKCSLCHSLDRVYVVKLTAEAMDHVVKRMRLRAPDWITPEQARKILEFMKTDPHERRKRQAVEGGPEVLFRERCTACHDLERVFLEADKPGAKDWMHIVKEMQEKAPEWVTPDEAQKIIAYLQTLKSAK